ncbi:MAG TPA: hypothetical protein VE377_14725 [Candidatus Dormibacteraeota bacterium]|nr:hypothetical protein [Candidatus Dormibacteraeota bacterium]
MGRTRGIVVFFLMLAALGCDDTKKGKGGPEKGEGGKTSDWVNPVAAKCPTEKPQTVSLKTKQYIVVQALADSCPVKLAGIADAECPRRGVLMREAAADADATISCTADDDKKKECHYRYFTGEAGKGMTQLLNDSVNTKCADGTTVLDLSKGAYNLNVQVDPSSDCAVEITGALSETREIGKDKTSAFRVDGDTAQVTLSCGSGDKKCIYSYTLSKQ